MEKEKEICFWNQKFKKKKKRWSIKPWYTLSFGPIQKKSQIKRAQDHEYIPQTLEEGIEP